MFIVLGSKLYVFCFVVLGKLDIVKYIYFFKSGSIFCWNYAIYGKDKASSFLGSELIVLIWVGTIGWVFFDFWCKLLIMLSEGKRENLLLSTVLFLD